MGRVILLILIIVAVVLLWKAFGPKSWRKNQLRQSAPPRQIKGPDDDEDFLWNLEKDRFKQRRAREAAAQEEAERMKRAKERYRETPRSESQEPPEGPEEPDTPADGK